MHERLPVQTALDALQMFIPDWSRSDPQLHSLAGGVKDALWLCSAKIRAWNHDRTIILLKWRVIWRKMILAVT